MKWILIIVLTGYNSGLEVETARFITQETCEEAARFIAESPKPNSAEISVQCMLDFI